jgi:hypothetical protein
MSRGIVSLATAALALAVMTGCTVAGDNGIPCDLVKRAPDGGSAEVTESEVTPGKDFVSFGAPECENFVCVRSSAAPKTGDPTARAKGKCSSRCASAEARCSSAVGEVKLQCRPLILDDVTLGKICLDDPGKCERFFGGAQTPYFCAEPSTVDAGN